MRSVAPSFGLFVALALLGGCRLLSLGVPCERDENCREDELCLEGLCVRDLDQPLPDGGSPVCPSPADPKSERLVLEQPLVIDSADALAVLEGVVVIEGEVRIPPSRALRTVSLPDLVEVTGGLHLAPLEPTQRTPRTYDAALPCLAEVGGDLVLDHDAAASFALPRLARVGGSLSARNGYERLPLPALAEVDEDLVLTGLAVEDLSDLSALDALGGLDITGNEALTSLEGLEAIEALPRGLALQQNPALKSLEGLLRLNALGGALLVVKNPALPTCEVEALRERLVEQGFRGAVRLRGSDDEAPCPWHASAPCPPVLDVFTCPAEVDDLNLLTDEDVANAQEVRCAANVVIGPTVSAVCLPALVEISGGLTLGDQHTATRVELPALRSTNTLYGSGASLKELSLPRLESVSSLELFHLPLVERLYLPRLHTVAGNLLLRDIGTAFVYLPELDAVAGQLHLERLEGAAQVDLPALRSVAGILALGENPTLTSLEGLSSLHEAGGLRIAQNPALLHLEGTSLEALHGDISVDNNAQLRSVDGIDASLSFSGAVVNVRDNPCLPEEDALSWAEAISPGAHDVSGNGTGECP